MPKQKVKYVIVYWRDAADMDGSDVDKLPPLMATMGKLYKETDKFVILNHHWCEKAKDSIFFEDAPEFTCIPKGWIERRETLT